MFWMGGRIVEILVSVGFMYKLVSSFPFHSLTRKSKKGILSVLDSYVDFILGWN